MARHPVNYLKTYLGLSAPQKVGEVSSSPWLLSALMFVLFLAALVRSLKHHSWGFAVVYCLLVVFSLGSSIGRLRYERGAGRRVPPG